jgi:hypothetical protein
MKRNVILVASMFVVSGTLSAATLYAVVDGQVIWYGLAANVLLPITAIVAYVTACLLTYAVLVRYPQLVGPRAAKIAGTSPSVHSAIDVTDGR